MRNVFGVIGVFMVTGCAVPSSQSNHQNLDVTACQKLADKTFRAGTLNYNLCPGYAPNGQKIELF